MNTFYCFSKKLSIFCEFKLNYLIARISLIRACYLQPEASLANIFEYKWPKMFYSTRGQPHAMVGVMFQLQPVLRGRSYSCGVAGWHCDWLLAWPRPHATDHIDDKHERVWNGNIMHEHTISMRPGIVSTWINHT